jgi:hypothetical protein
MVRVTSSSQMTMQDVCLPSASATRALLAGFISMTQDVWIKDTTTEWAQQKQMADRKRDQWPTCMLPMAPTRGESSSDITAKTSPTQQEHLDALHPGCQHRCPTTTAKSALEYKGRLHHGGWDQQIFQ